MAKQVDINNIQGSIWPRVPRFYETYLFFKITKDTSEDAEDDDYNVDKFKEHLKKLVESKTDGITTGAECKKYLVKYGGGITEARAKYDILPEDRKTFNSINVAFTGKGVLMLVGDRKKMLLRDLLHSKGMYQDLVFEGPDEPGNLNEEYKPPHGYPANNGNWRNDGTFIVSAQTKEELNKTIQKVKDYFCVGQGDKASIEITVTKNGHVRNADGKAEKNPGEHLHGKEHFGFEDQISQPQIQGLDAPPEPNEPRAIPPGWILLGHEGDNTGSPEWAHDGSYLVFREIEERVMEFNKFTKEESKKLEGFKGEDGGEKLAAHMMGRWKNGAPVVLDEEGKPGGNEENAFENDFEYRHKYASAKEVKCPFAAHTRKMRPRADLYVAKNGDKEEVTMATNTVENSNVILRRSITFGPELTDKEKETETDIETRGIYFCCYQGDLRNGFNFLVTRWASNRTFGGDQKIDADPGVDPIVSQATNREETKPTFGIFEKNDSAHPTAIDLKGIPWIAQKGGEYFFTPSIKALKTTFVDEVQ